MEIREVASLVESDLKTDIISQSFNWIDSLCVEYTKFFKNKYGLDIEFKLKTDEMLDSYKEFSAFTIVGKSIVNIGVGLLRFIAQKICCDDKETIDNFFPSIPKSNQNVTYVFIINSIFISAVFAMINHEIVHTIFGHSTVVDNDEMKKEETSADCCGGSLLRIVYDSIFNSSANSLKDIDNRKQLAATSVIIGVAHGLYSLKLISCSNSSKYHAVRMRALHVGLAFILEIGLNGDNYSAVLNNFGHVYCKFFDTDIDTFNKDRQKAFKDIEQSHCAIAERIKLSFNRPPSTPDA